MAPRKVKAQPHEKTASTVKNQSRDEKPWQFKPGQSGNPAGRTKGTRNKLNEDFVAALCEDFQEHGVSVIQTVRAEKPDVYLKVVASLQPKEIDVRDKTLEDMTDNELFDALAEIRSLKAGLNRAAVESGKKPPKGNTRAARQLN